MPTHLPWKVVWVTGASTGIGREVVMQLAAAGVKVAASARSASKLQSLGANCVAYPLDVTDLSAVQNTVAKIEAELGPIDLAVFGAGTYAAIDATEIDPVQFATMLNTNYLGVVNCLSALLPKMLGRSQGHISWIASVAGYRGLPKAAAYGPSKAALINLAESLKPELALKGITISVINPGFVETPMTSKNDFPMPFLMQPADAARRTIAGLAKGKFEIAYPTRFVAILKFTRILPYRLFFWLITKTTLKQ
jgi:NAD(P)-dependent dehydrogenase (short-subunit alcohol dehydrogenase family)